MTTNLEFFHSMMDYAVKKGNLVNIRTAHLEIFVKVLEERVGYYSCEGINMIYIPLEKDIEKVARYETIAGVRRMVKLTDGTILEVFE